MLYLLNSILKRVDVMSLESMNKFLKSKCTTLSLALVLASPTAAQAQSYTKEQIDARKKEALQKVKDYQKGKSNTLVISLENGKAFEFVRENGEQYTIVDNAVCDKNMQASTKTAKKEYSKEQQQAFNNAEKDGTQRKDLESFLDDINEKGAVTMGGYSPTEKNIIINSFNLTPEELNELKESKNYTPEQAQQIIEKYNRFTVTPSEEISTLSHENQHKINDLNNAYAPGLNAVEYGKLNCWDECSAKVAELVVANHKYKESLSAGASKEEALKEFDVSGGDFSFYKEAIAGGLNPDSHEAKELMVNGTIKMWKENYLEIYMKEQVPSTMRRVSLSNDVNAAGLLIGNEQDYSQRKDKMFDSFDQNPEIQKLGIKVGKLSQYLPKEDFQLSENFMIEANKITKERTGFSLDEGKQISDALPGSQKKDQKTLAKALSNPKKMLQLSGRISAAINEPVKKEGNTITQTQQKGLTALSSLQKSVER